MLMNVDESLDYSAHELQAKALLKKIHELLLKKEYRAAAGLIDNTIVELRLMRVAVKSHIKE
jgi:predicted chitinase